MDAAIWKEPTAQAALPSSPFGSLLFEAPSPFPNPTSISTALEASYTYSNALALDLGSDLPTVFTNDLTDTDPNRLDAYNAFISISTSFGLSSIPSASSFSSLPVTPLDSITWTYPHPHNSDSAPKLSISTLDSYATTQVYAPKSELAHASNTDPSSLPSLDLHPLPILDLYRSYNFVNPYLVGPREDNPEEDFLAQLEISIGLHSSPGSAEFMKVFGDIIDARIHGLDCTRPLPSRLCSPKAISLLMPSPFTNEGIESLLDEIVIGLEAQFGSIESMNVSKEKTDAMTPDPECLYPSPSPSSSAEQELNTHSDFSDDDIELLLDDMKRAFPIPTFLTSHTLDSHPHDPSIDSSPYPPSSTSCSQSQSPSMRLSKRVVRTSSLFSDASDAYDDELDTSVAPSLPLSSNRPASPS